VCACVVGQYRGPTFPVLHFLPLQLGLSFSTPVHHFPSARLGLAFSSAFCGLSSSAPTYAESANKYDDDDNEGTRTTYYLVDWMLPCC